MSLNAEGILCVKNMKENEMNDISKKYCTILRNQNPEVLTYWTIGRFERKGHAIIAVPLVWKPEFNGFLEFQAMWSAHYQWTQKCLAWSE